MKLNARSLILFMVFTHFLKWGSGVMPHSILIKLHSDVLPFHHPNSAINALEALSAGSALCIATPQLTLTLVLIERLNILWNLMHIIATTQMPRTQNKS